METVDGEYSCSLSDLNRSPENADTEQAFCRHSYLFKTLLFHFCGARDRSQASPFYHRTTCLARKYFWLNPSKALSSSLKTTFLVGAFYHRVVTGQLLVARCVEDIMHEAQKLLPHSPYLPQARALLARAVFYKVPSFGAIFDNS